MQQQYLSPSVGTDEDTRVAVPLSSRLASNPGDGVDSMGNKREKSHIIVVET